ncbi:MAG: hypothetical protein ABII00_19150 [Elusimicrobiota bacterium]
MESEGRMLTVRIELGRRQIASALALLLLCLLPAELTTEEMTRTTYYPSPFGVYEKMRSTDNTRLAYTSGRVGVGTTEPAAELDVRGHSLIQGNADISGKADVALNVAAGNGDVEVGQSAEGFHIKANRGDLVLGGAGGKTGEVHIGNSSSYFLGQMCRYVDYNQGVTYCPNGGRGWSVVSWGGVSDRFSGTAGAWMGRMLCCKMEPY